MQVESSKDLTHDNKNSWKKKKSGTYKMSSYKE